MSDSDIIATPSHEPPEDAIHDEEDRLLPSFVREVLDAVADGDDEAARALVAGLHPADIADHIELAPGDERADGLRITTSSISSCRLGGLCANKRPSACSSS